MSERQVPELSLLSYVNGSSNDQIDFVNGIYNGKRLWIYYFQTRAC